MSLKTFVKIGSISNLSDARYCSGMMVDILGFNLEEGTENAVSKETFEEITNWVAGVQFAGEFANAHPAEIKLAAEQLSLNYIEVQNLETLEELSAIGIPLIYKLVINEEADLPSITTHIEVAKDLADLIILHSSNESLSPKIEQAISTTSSEKLIRSYGLNEQNMADLAEGNVFKGIELLGTPEDRPGFKDYGQVMDLLELIEED